MVITTSNLSRSFGDLKAVNSINLEVEEGTVFGFLGPNGSGKTTTVRMLLGLIKADSGTISLFNSDLKHERNKILQNVGALIESPALYPHLTGKENLKLYQTLLGLPKQNIEYALKTVKMSYAENKRIQTYSLGMKQRLALALAILQKPKLLILDEPTNGLDPSGILEIRELIKEMAKQQGISIFLCSHYLSEVEQVANTIGIINKGEILYQGSLNGLQDYQVSKLQISLDKTDDALKLLKEHKYEAVIENGMFEVKIKKVEECAEINSLLVQNGIRVSHLTQITPSLESIFLQMTEEK